MHMHCILRTSLKEAPEIIIVQIVQSLTLSSDWDEVLYFIYHSYCCSFTLSKVSCTCNYQLLVAAILCSFFLQYAAGSTHACTTEKIFCLVEIMLEVVLLHQEPSK